MCVAGGHGSYLDLSCGEILEAVMVSSGCVVGELYRDRSSDLVG